MQKISAHGVNLPLDGVARHGPFGPAFWNHRTEPYIADGKQHGHLNSARKGLPGACRIQCLAVQGKVRGLRNNGTGKCCLKLRSRLKPLH